MVVRPVAGEKRLERPAEIAALDLQADELESLVDLCDSILERARRAWRGVSPPQLAPRIDRIQSRTLHPDDPCAGQQVRNPVLFVQSGELRQQAAQQSRMQSECDAARAEFRWEGAGTWQGGWMVDGVERRRNASRRLSQDERCHKSAALSCRARKAQLACRRVELCLEADASTGRHGIAEGH